MARLSRWARMTHGWLFRDVWKKLLPADREILRLLANGVTDLFSEPACLRLGTALGIDKAVTNNTPQQSLRRLQDEELVVKLDYGKYELNDDVFAEWLRTLELDT